MGHAAMYKIIMIVGGSIVILGWLAYWLYNYIEDQREKKAPTKSKRLEDAHESMSDYAQKMAKFEKKRYNKQQ